MASKKGGRSDRGSARVSVGRALRGTSRARSSWILALSCHPLKGQIALILLTAAPESPQWQVTPSVFFGVLISCVPPLLHSVRASDGA